MQLLQEVEAPFKTKCEALAKARHWSPYYEITVLHFALKPERSRSCCFMYLVASMQWTNLLAEQIVRGSGQVSAAFTPHSLKWAQRSFLTMSLVVDRKQKQLKSSLCSCAGSMRACRTASAVSSCCSRASWTSSEGSVILCSMLWKRKLQLWTLLKVRQCANRS